MSDPNRWRDHQDRWARERLEPAQERSPERRQRFITQSGVDIGRVYTPADLADPANDPDADRPRYRFSPPTDERPGWDEIDDLGLPGRATLHPRHPPDRSSRAPVDDADVRRLRHGRGDERALQDLLAQGGTGL